MIQAETPPAVAQPAPAAATDRRETTEMVVNEDQRLVLVKAGQREHAMVRRALFVTSTVTATLTTETQPTYAWSHRSYMHRQVCFTSMTGLFACATPAVEPLPDRETGQAALTEPDAYPAADAAAKKLAAGLKARAPALFEADRKLNIEPFLRSAGVTIAPTTAPVRKAAPPARKK